MRTRSSKAKLRALKDASGVTPEETARYEFVLTNALDTVDSSTEDHRKLMAEQQEASKHKNIYQNSRGAGRVDNFREDAC